MRERVFMEDSLNEMQVIDSSRMGTMKSKDLRDPESNKIEGKQLCDLWHVAGHCPSRGQAILSFTKHLYRLLPVSRSLL